jgi:hypothetical protein
MFIEFDINKHSYLLNNYFMGNDIKNYIKNSSKTYKVVKSNTYTINIIDYGIKDYKINNFVNRVKFFQKLINTTRHVTIWWFPTAFKKTFPNNTKFIDLENINSGSTTFYGDSSKDYIVIFRYEEAYKVLFHELVHFYNLDKTLGNELDDYYRKYYNLNDKIPFSIRETYAEIVATLLNIYYINNTLLDYKFNRLLLIEQTYSIDLLQRIFSYFEIKNVDQLYKLSSNTNLATYYVVKSCILLDKKVVYFFRKILENRLKINSKLFSIFLAKKNLETIFSYPLIKLNTKTLRMTIIE